MAANRIASDDERAPRAAPAESAAEPVERAGKPLGEFASALFARVAPEDLVRYEPRELADLAADAWEFLAVRRPGTPKVRIESPPASAGQTLKTISVVEIANDDMPFKCRREHLIFCSLSQFFSICRVDVRPGNG